MVIYEVNISVNNEIFQDFYDWLQPHVKKILSFTGFLHCEIGLIENENDDNKYHLRINYEIDSYDNLQNYLTNHAPQMRADTVQQFGEKFSVTRRVILEPVTLSSEI